MPTRRPPGFPALEHLQIANRQFQGLVQRGDAVAVADLAELDPASLPDADHLPVTKAQLVVARRYRSGPLHRAALPTSTPLLALGQGSGQTTHVTTSTYGQPHVAACSSGV